MKFLLSIFFLFYLLVVFGQLKDSQSPEEYVSHLIQLSEDARETNRTKSLSYLQEALTLEKEVSDTMLINLYHTAGLIYKDQESYYMAINYFYKELELQEKTNPQQLYSILNNLGGCYYLMGNPSKAREFWEKSLTHYETYLKKNKNISGNREGSLIYNNLAVIEKKEGNYAKALEMLKEFKSQNEILKDTANIILAQENLADVYFKLNEKNIAIFEIQTGISLAKRINSPYDLSSLYKKLGEIYFASPDREDSALYYLKNAYNLSDNHGFVDLKLSSSESLVSLYENDGNFKEALKYLHTAKSLSEESIGNENTKRVSRLEFEFNEKMKQNELIQSQKKREIYFIAGIILLLFLSAIAFLMFQLQKSKSQKRAAENQLLARQLEEKNKEITSHAIQMLQTSEILENTHKELRDLKTKSDSSHNKVLSQIISDLKKGTQVFNKVEFEKLFMETDGDFYKRLLDKYPNLTKNELRLCAFLRLNLSSKEISAITQQSPHSIVVARSRLRKKINLDENKSLTNFLVQF